MAAKAAHPCVVTAFCKVIFLTSFLLLLGCNENTQQTSRNASWAVVLGGEIPGVVRPEHYPLLLNRLNQLAAALAIDCGMVENWETPDDAPDCARSTRE